MMTITLHYIGYDQSRKCSQKSYPCLHSTEEHEEAQEGVGPMGHAWATMGRGTLTWSRMLVPSLPCDSNLIWTLDGGISGPSIGERKYLGLVGSLR